MRLKSCFKLWVFFFLPVWVWAVQIPEYDPEVNDRFSSGYPSAPVPNTSPDFIGAGFDWSGVGWAASDTRKGLGFLSPRHYIMAHHFWENNGNTIRIHGTDGVVHSQTQQSRVAFDLGVYFGDPYNYNDLSAGRLSQSFSRSAMPVRHAILDLHSSSTSNISSPYTSLSLLMYGRGGTNPVTSPRIGSAPVSSVNIGATSQTLVTQWSDVRLEGGDSGSPGLNVWSNPAGGQELTLVSMHSSIDEDTERNIDSFVATFQTINALNDFMRPDGRALRVAGNPNGTWRGGGGAPATRSNLNSIQNWDGSFSDQYVQFNADATTYLSPVVNSDTNLRGLYFLPTASSTDGFTFTGSNILTVGRGGVVNYDNRLQTFNAPLRLGADQIWHPGPGGITVSTLNTNGFLLELDEENTLVINGLVSGSGGLAVGRGLMVLEQNSSYTGDTWVHEGELRVLGNISSSPNLHTGAGGGLTGTGMVATIQGAGEVRPHSGVLSATQVNPGSGLDFSFTFGSQDLVSNPVLRLFGTTPFSPSLSSTNQVKVVFDAGPLAAGHVYRGGFFTDKAADFLSSVSNASWVFQVMDGGESQPIPADLEILISTEPAQLDVGGGTVNGQVLVLMVQSTSEPSPYDVWADEVFPEGTPEEDKDPYAAPNEVGLINLLAYAHRIDPLEPDMTLRPWSELKKDELVFRFRRNTQASDLVFRVEKSENLHLDWQDAELSPAILDPDPDGDGGAELLEVRISIVEAPSLLFLRVLVESTASISE